MNNYSKQHPLVSEKDSAKKSIILRSLFLAVLVALIAGIVMSFLYEEGYDDWLEWADREHEAMYAFLVPFIVAFSIEYPVNMILNFSEKSYDVQVAALECAHEAQLNTEIILKSMPDVELPGEKDYLKPTTAQAQQPPVDRNPSAPSVPTVTCPRCKSLQRSDRTFCINCGINLTNESGLRQCPECKCIISNDTDTHCSICGTPLK